MLDIANFNLNLEQITQVDHSVLIERLSSRIFELMIQDPEKLYFHLYRVDIDDHYLEYLRSKYKKEEELAIQLATIVLDRTIQKLKTQKEFKD